MRTLEIYSLSNFQIQHGINYGGCTSQQGRVRSLRIRTQINGPVLGELLFDPEDPPPPSQSCGEAGRVWARAEIAHQLDVRRPLDLEA